MNSLLNIFYILVSIISLFYFINKYFSKNNNNNSNKNSINNSNNNSNNSNNNNTLTQPSIPTNNIITAQIHCNQHPHQQQQQQQHPQNVTPKDQSPQLQSNNTSAQSHNQPQSKLFDSNSSQLNNNPNPPKE
ncbi:hypothetical protein DICPUDRAFT_148957 [Dictyostelium purpureum]|uniref:Uncharacterized protein n=1 Tax=Dictyostelium purpureum TaxID=5786 RepID=F0ZCF7_DICPU|nr:uncharacterized protein DICPUDRAFT_148957 [Dictyostelium purpureum]EGC38360.1 hypothetical protein DICPUDRAFT_148957 [Dictyostelium purpureum]|eukprot:XP_003285117.1 hypothetical protein DICPUDRAFT_148957 [Dictyostelium purpureum]